MPTITIHTKFWEYSQNNSGGYYEDIKGVGRDVWIEATSAGDADRRAEALGIYFEGVRAGRDCGCCGDRWSRAWRDGEEEPTNNSPVHRMTHETMPGAEPSSASQPSSSRRTETGE